MSRAKVLLVVKYYVVHFINVNVSVKHKSQNANESVKDVNKLKFAPRSTIVSNTRADTRVLSRNG